MFKIAFLSEGTYQGKIQRSFPNMRVDLAWQCLLESDHYNITSYELVSNYDFIFIIWPKGDVLINSEGLQLTDTQRKNNSQIFERSSAIIEKLKANNKKVGFIQEGPTWFSNDYTLLNQIHHFNIITESDFIFCHNYKDTAYYKGITDKPVHVINSIIINDLLEDIKNEKENKTIIGGNFTNWYGGFNSFLVASKFNNPVWCPSMHNKQPGEEQFVNHFQYMPWIDWMKELSKFKFAVHLMPTLAAGTFSLNCATFGIPCIGNENLDTQSICFPDLSIDVNDIYKANKLVDRLNKESDFYSYCSNHAISTAKTYYAEESWLDNINKVLNEIQ